MTTYETTVIPARGRDYKTAKAALADWEAGKDFIICNLFHPYDGKPINVHAGVNVKIRFCGNTKTVIAEGKAA